jgi:hypothetical protein
MSNPTWPFDQERNVAAIASRSVVFDGQPVLLVIHYSDDYSWAFLDGRTFRTEDACVVSMAEAVGRDHALNEIADLKPGWTATREQIGSPWQRQSDPDV